MQGDLISRKELIEKFNNTGIQITFDLPVEEVLGEDVDIDDFAMLVQDAIQSYKKMVIGVIQELPTAYDVEKVMAELEQQAEQYKRRALELVEKSTEAGIHTKGKSLSYEHAIEIVRNGGKE